MMKTRLIAIIQAVWVFASVAAGAVFVDFDALSGPVKPVNGVGQPPLISLDGTNLFHYLSEAGIPYSRLHDVGGHFGAGVFVDVPNIFRNFDADETQAENYDFYYTDLLLKGLVNSGVEPYFRLGVSIENAAGRGGKAYRIFPPKDYAKWARICEHVIRHYIEGWADGLWMKISHWEIWNEPENYETIEQNQMWKAPFDEYIRLYVVASRHLKARFPELKIGGYASCGLYGVASSWARPERPRIAFLMKCFTDFLSAVRKESAPLDFFSFHCYDRPAFAAKQIAYVRETLDAYGFGKTEMSLNEWIPCDGGPVKGETGSMHQAAEIAAMLCVMQNGAVDDAEIYDARARGGNYAPFFEPDTFRLRKGYYIYLAFNELRKLGKSVSMPELPTGVFATAAADGQGNAAVMLANVSEATWCSNLHFGSWRLSDARVINGEVSFQCASFDGRVAPDEVWLLNLKK